MKLRQIAEAAVYVSAHSPTFIDAPGSRRESALAEFWLLSRQRLHDWTAAIDERLLSTFAGSDEVLPYGEVSLPVLLEEVFLAEVLARVWTATLAAADRSSGANRYERLVRNVYIGHLQARHRALSLITEGRRLPAAELPRLDQIRRRAERWTDVLLGHLVCRYGVDEFTFDASRARDFGRTQRTHGQVWPGHPVWGLILAGLRVSFPDRLRLSKPQSQRNRSLAAAALAMIPDAAINAAFDSTNAPRLTDERISTDSADRRPALDRIEHKPACSGGTGAGDGASSSVEDALAFAKLRRSQPDT